MDEDHLKITQVTVIKLRMVNKVQLVLFFKPLLLVEILPSHSGLFPFAREHENTHPNPKCSVDKFISVHS